MSPVLLGLLWALVFALPVSVLTRFRFSVRRARTVPKGAHHQQQRVASAGSYSWRAAAVFTLINVVLLFVIDTFAFYRGRPMMTLAGLTGLIIANTFLMVIATFLTSPKRLNAGAAVAALATVTFGAVYVVGHNSGHSSYLASHLVGVTIAAGDQMPASSTDHMVIVSPDIATTKASQAMATGIAGQRNYSTYLRLGPATLQYVDGRMWYVFPLEFDGAGNKARLHAMVPGYIMVSAEDPDAVPVEHYDGQYSMKISLGGGQGSEPDRWAYSHGYDGYLLDNPTLEVSDQGLPYYTVTLLRPSSAGRSTRRWAWW